MEAEGEESGGVADSGKKKHPCPDCRCCQWCSDDRCRMCLREKRSCPKLSLEEQIALYEEINRRGIH